VKKILGVIALFFVGVYFLLTQYFPEVQINKYDSIETAKKQKAIENGWLPKNLPASAYAIIETHNLDSNIVFGKFSYKEEDEESFLNGLKYVDEIYRKEEFLFKINQKENLVNFRNTNANKGMK